MPVYCSTARTLGSVLLHTVLCLYRRRTFCAGLNTYGKEYSIPTLIRVNPQTRRLWLARAIIAMSTAVVRQTEAGN